MMCYRLLGQSLTLVLKGHISHSIHVEYDTLTLR